MLLTIEQFNEFEPDAIIAQGITQNNSNGLFMTNDNIDRDIRYVALKGHNNDWCIYCHWANTSTYQSVCEVGDKVTSEQNIMNVVPCEKEVLKRYRY